MKLQLTSEVFFCFLFCLLTVNHCDGKKVFYAEWDEDDQTVSVERAKSVEKVPEDAVAFALYENKINETGWSFLEIHSSPDYADDKQIYSAGFLEGYATHRLIWLNWLNTQKDFCKKYSAECYKIDKYINANQKWMKQSIHDNSEHDPYWYQVKLLKRQLQGITDGYNEANTNPKRKLTYRNLLYMNMAGDLEDLLPAVRGVSRPFTDSHCSALVKVLPDWSDVLVSHNTWTGYQAMLRVQKKFNLNIHVLEDDSKIIEGYTMSFSSYPGYVSSIDDFYVLSSRLVVQETTLGNNDVKNWKSIHSEGQLSEFIRVMVANRLAKDGPTWTEYFEIHNSGTYNNQWMIIDYKKFTPGKKTGLKKDFFWILEQVPGMVEKQDMTKVLKSQKYWPSYNIPYFPKIFKRIKSDRLVRQYGEWFSYEKNPRALIFKRDQGKVKDLDGMLALMTYNDFKHDPLSRCDCDPPYSASNAIASRSDLNLKNGSYPFGPLSYKPHGAIDVKITDSTLSLDYQFVSVSGPAHNQSRGIPPFDWTTSDFRHKLPHFGHPNRWEFEPITYEWLDDSDE